MLGWMHEIHHEKWSQEHSLLLLILWALLIQTGGSGTESASAKYCKTENNKDGP